PRAEGKHDDDRGQLNRERIREKPPEQQAGCRAECTRRVRHVADSEAGRQREGDGAHQASLLDQAVARTTRVPAQRSCSARRSRVNSAVRRPRPAGIASIVQITVRTIECGRSTDLLGSLGTTRMPVAILPSVWPPAVNATK